MFRQSGATIQASSRTSKSGFKIRKCSFSGLFDFTQERQRKDCPYLYASVLLLYFLQVRFCLQNYVISATIIY
jgi:hypothetical protein